MKTTFPIGATSQIRAVLSVAIFAGCFIAGRAYAESETTEPAGEENTVDTCRDGEDNDGDKHIDCDDQDCHVFIICGPDLLRRAVTADEEPVPPGPIEQGDLCSDGIDNDGNGLADCDDETCGTAPWCPAGGEAGPLCRDGQDNDADRLVDCEEPSCQTSRYCEAGPEMGLQCQDETDNDKNGLIDCQEPSCQDSEFCRDQIYYVPEPKNKPVGLLLSLGLGFAFPNWSPPSGEVEIEEGEPRYVIPYLPDVGPVADLQAEYLFTPWIGFGVKGMLTGTGVQSRDDWSDEDYKFDGLKVHFFAGGFVRFQYPFERIVPFIKFAGGYSYVQYRWVTFSRFEETGEMSKTLDRIMEPPSHHATFAFEVGMDVFIIKRFIAAGLKAWLPIAATSDSSMDNTAAFISISWTPLWPEERTIRPEYLDPPPQAPSEPEGAE